VQDFIALFFGLHLAELLGAEEIESFFFIVLFNFAGRLALCFFAKAFWEFVAEFW
jgi:hypothetical protein